MWHCSASATLTRQHLNLLGSVTPHELAQLAAEGAVGDVVGQVFRSDGQLKISMIRLISVVIAITLDELQSHIPTTLWYAAGVEKKPRDLRATYRAIRN